MNNNYIYYYFLEFSDELDGDYYMTVGYAYKALKLYYLNQPIYGNPHKKDGEIKSLINYWFKECNYKLNNKGHKIYKIQDVYNIFESKEKEIEEIKKVFSDEDSIYELLDKHNKIVESINELSSELFSKIENEQGDLIKVIHALNIVFNKENFFEIKDIDSEIEIFKKIIEEYSNARDELSYIMLGESIEFTLKSTSVNEEFITVQEIYNAIEKNLRLKYEPIKEDKRKLKDPILLNTKTKKIQIRTFLDKGNCEKYKNEKNIYMYSLTDVITVFSSANMRFNINKWFFENNNHIKELMFFTNRIKRANEKLVGYVDKLRQIITSIADFQKQTINHIYYSLKRNSEINPFDTNQDITNFDDEVERRMIQDKKSGSWLEAIKQTYIEANITTGEILHEDFLFEQDKIIINLEKKFGKEKAIEIYKEHYS